MELITHLVQVLLSMTLGTQAVHITHHPRDQNVSIGGVARFQCAYNESRSFPFWFINNALYTIQGLPSLRYFFYDQTLILRDIQVSDNLTTYQCVFPDVRSDQATLFVVPLADDVTTTLSMTISTTTGEANSIKTCQQKTTTASTTANMITEEVMESSHDNNETRKTDHTIIVLVIEIGSVVSASLVLTSIVLAIAIIAMRFYRKRNKTVVISDGKEHEEVNAIKIQLNLSMLTFEGNHCHECETEENTGRKARAERDTYEDKLNLASNNDACHIMLHQSPNNHVGLMGTNILEATSSEKTSGSVQLDTNNVSKSMNLPSPRQRERNLSLAE